MTNSNYKFSLSSEECEVLLNFEATSSLQELASLIGRDHSVVARMFKRISEKHPVVEKQAGKWKLTQMGRKINDTSRSLIAIQNSILNSQATLRIGTNREFAARVLARDFSVIQSLFPNTLLIFKTFQNGTEDALLSGQIDVGIDCERPIDPEVSFRLVVDEPIVAVGSKRFLQQYKKRDCSKGVRHLTSSVL